MGRIIEMHVDIAIVTVVTFVEKQIYFDAWT